jgi:hypothetical protein
MHLPENKPPSEKTFHDAVAQVISASKMTGTPQISRLRRGSPSAPGDWMACLRSVGTAPSQPYALFFNGDALADFRLAVMMDECGAESYSPFSK